MPQFARNDRVTIHAPDRYTATATGTVRGVRDYGGVVWYVVRRDDRTRLYSLSDVFRADQLTPLNTPTDSARP
jgi:hypothetical protein